MSGLTKRRGERRIATKGPVTWVLSCGHEIPARVERYNIRKSAICDVCRLTMARKPERGVRP